MQHILNEREEKRQELILTVAPCFGECQIALARITEWLYALGRAQLQAILVNATEFVWVHNAFERYVRLFQEVRVVRGTDSPKDIAESVMCILAAVGDHREMTSFLNLVMDALNKCPSSDW